MILDKITGKFRYFKKTKYTERKTTGSQLCRRFAERVCRHPAQKYHSHLQQFLNRKFDSLQENYHYFLYPGIGILLTYIFVKFVVKDDISHGVTKVLESISRKKGYLRAHNMFTSIISSTITIGFGGSSRGRSACCADRLRHWLYLRPHLQSELPHHDSSDRLWGRRGHFRYLQSAPRRYAFAIEVLMLDLTMASLLPLMISAATAASLAYFPMGSGYELNFQIDHAFKVTNIHWYILLGIFCGLFSVLFSRGNLLIESSLKKIRSPLLRIVIGGLALGGMIFLFPSLWGRDTTPSTR